MYAKQAPEPSFIDGGLDEPVWGAAAIGKVINRSPRQTYHLLQTGQIPATQVGRQYVSTRRRLRGRVTPAEG
jgi:hypothetical protein